MDLTPDMLFRALAAQTAILNTTTETFDERFDRSLACIKSWALASDDPAPGASRPAPLRLVTWRSLKEAA